MNSIILENMNGDVTDLKVIHHLKNNLKVKLDHHYRCTVLNHGVFTARLESIKDSYCKFEILTESLKKEPWFHLIVGVSRPQTTKKILEHATTFGAKSIIFFKASLSEKSYLTSTVFNENEMFEYLKDGLSQSGIYYQLPDVKIYQHNPANIFKDYSHKFVLDLETKNIFNQNIGLAQEIVLAIGPERGWINDDLRYFNEADFKKIKISDSILRVEHAIYSSISQLEYLKLNKENI